jgi:hypothetical protein
MGPFLPLRIMPIVAAPQALAGKRPEDNTFASWTAKWLQLFCSERRCDPIANALLKRSKTFQIGSDCGLDFDVGLLFVLRHLLSSPLLSMCVVLAEFGERLFAPDPKPFGALFKRRHIKLPIATDVFGERRCVIILFRAMPHF